MSLFLPQQAAAQLLENPWGDLPGRYLPGHLVLIRMDWDEDVHHKGHMDDDDGSGLLL